MKCPICGSAYFTEFKKYPAYKVCLVCNLYCQETLPGKVYEGPGENGVGPGSGHLMSDDEKSININLANALHQMFLPDTVLDIGSKYPIFLSALKDKAEVLGMDAIPEILKYGEELGVPVVQADFESVDITPYKGKFDLITLVHTFEHFYNPLETLQKVFDCLSSRGILYMRIPDMGVEGIERDFTEHHLTIHPYIYTQQTLYMLSEKLGYEIFRVDNLGHGQSDFYLRKRKEKFTLSVCMIVKNEEKNITDCLESIKDIADEIIVVDTGSEDKTKEVVLKYTSKIYDFEWIDDFSAARNFSLSKATGDFILWVDADDIVENPEDILPLLKQSFDVHDFKIIYGNDTFHHARLFRNFRNIYFNGRVHEYPVLDSLFQSAGIPSHFLAHQRVTKINVIHKTEKHSTEDRSERNYRILKKELEEDPKNARALFYLGNSLKEMAQYDAAIETYRKYLEIATWVDERWMAQKNIGNILLWQKKPQTAIEEFTKAISIDSRWAESYYYIGECYFILEDYLESIDWMMKATKKELPSSPLWKEASVYKEAPYRYIFASYEILGDLERAIHYCKIAIEENPSDQWLKDRLAYFYDKASKEKPSDLWLKDRLANAPKIIECFRQGALGDCLMTTAALRGLKQKYPDSFIHYVAHPHSMQILEGNKYIDELTTESKYENAEKIYFCYPDKDSVLGDEGYPDKPLNRHLVKIFNECAGLPNNSMDMECTLTEQEDEVGRSLRTQYKRYLTLHAKSGWSEYKDWYNDRWELVVEELFKKGFVTVQIGHESDPLLSNTIDFRGHTIKESIAAIKYADVHMGVDSFSNHAAATFNVSSIILFGSTSPAGSGYERNLNICKDLPCQPCYREYNSKDKCPHGKKCMDKISAEEVLKGALMFLSEGNN